MSLLLEHFDTIFDSPESTKKLQELILDMAVRGKLVPQDLNDEPASVLLEKIKIKKEKLIKEKKIKKEKTLPPITEEEKPFELPKGWEWVRLQYLIEKIGAGSTPRGGRAVYVDAGIKFIRSQNVWNDGLYLKDIACITEEINNKMSGSIVKPNDLLLNITGASIGRCCIVPSTFDIGNVNQHVSIIRLVDDNDTLRHYLHYCLISNYIQKTIMSTQVGISREGLSISKLIEFKIPIPPLSEQKRIVEKVDRLMNFCEMLKKQLEKKQRRKDRLNKSAFSSLEKSTTEAELRGSLQFVISNLQLLCTDTEHVLQLRNSILSLAVKGKLVTKNENGEPASMLLEKIAEEKERLIREKKLKREKPLSQITNEEKPFNVPKGWEWVRLQDISHLITKGSSPKWQGVEYTENPDDVLFITSENVGKFNLILKKKKYVEKKFNEIAPRSLLQKGDLLMNIVGASIGRTAIFNEDACANINQAVCLIRLTPLVIKEYLLLFFNSPLCISYMYDKQVDSARANLSMSNIAKFLISLPPLHEQQRIVEKVNRLMILCDELEANIEKSKHESEQLMKSVLQETFTVKEEVLN
ncbi:type I restriction endonuclease subunit S [Bacillus thuringiensis]|uniref:restriction endonuclease subunit S n=1 Tax=Bacillus thuringiensis TaxID=1428 RepID=UPI000BFDECD6|nr:restriction endonuclease subunit S [Bacillus thuringiensis]PGH71494.1 type I restriction endonuclease subunit S [Bacillus thuringiensis]